MPGHQWRGQQPGMRWALAQHQLEEGRQEDKGAEQRRRGDRDDSNSNGEDPVAEQRQRQDRLGRDALAGQQPHNNTNAPSASPTIVGDDHAAMVPPQLSSSNNAAVVMVSSTAPG